MVAITSGDHTPGRERSAAHALPDLLAGLRPQRRPGDFVFVAVPDDNAVTATDVLASVREPESLTLVMTREAADADGLYYDFVASWITLQVHSALSAVGLTAAVSAALAESGIACNVIAGYHHDHLLVPVERADDAVAVLVQLSVDHQRATGTEGPGGPPA